MEGFLDLGKAIVSLLEFRLRCGRRRRSSGRRYWSPSGGRLVSPGVPFVAPRDFQGFLVEGRETEV